MSATVIMSEIEAGTTARASRYARYTLEECKESSSHHDTRSGWAKHSQGAYTASIRNGWLEECCAHMKVLNRAHTFEECLASARKYSTKLEWRLNEGHIAYYAYKMGWEKACTAHMTKIVKGAIFSVYIYKFSDGCAYIGITRCISARKLSHKRSGPVAAHIKSTGIVPELEIIESNLSSDDAAIKEVRYLEEASKTYRMLNTAKAGNTGPYTTTQVYTFEVCTEHSKKYSSRKEWSKGDRGSHDAAYKYGWIDQIMPLSIKRHLFCKCVNAAKSYENKRAWCNEDRDSHDAAYRHGWIKFCPTQAEMNLSQKVINAPKAGAQLTSTISIT